MPETALIDFITKSCHFYFDHIIDKLDTDPNNLDPSRLDTHPEVIYFEELLNTINSIGWESHDMNTTWQLDSDFDYL
jgi:hypothetical protein